MSSTKMNPGDINTNEIFDWEKNTWEVIDTFFKQDNILIEHHLNSFNYFMNHDLQSIVREKEFNPIKIFNKNTWNEEKQLYLETYQIEFGKIYISKPVLYDAPNKPMYPSEARLRKLTYGANLYLDIHHKTVQIDPETGEHEITQHPTLDKFPCGRMPIMVGSKYCVLNDQNNMTKMEMGEGIYDYGGYFIVKGSEKVIISQEKKCENKICCFKTKSIQNKYSEVAEISCIHPDNPSVISPVYIKMKSKEESYGGNVIRVRLKRMKQEIPLIIIFRALNFISDKSIVELIVYNIAAESSLSIMELVKASIEEAKSIQTQKIALEYISKYITGIQSVKYKTNKCKLKYTFDVLCNELFPHVGESPIKKAFFLGYMVNKLLKCSIGLIKYDDRDSFLNKRVETSGDLMAQLFRAYFGKFAKELKASCEKDMLADRMSELPQNLSKKLKPNSIENDIKYALGTGNWGLKNQAKPRKGIAAVLQRLTYLGTLSNLRRVVAPIDKNGKLTDPRKLHCTQWGVICPFETPEGGGVGIVKNMSLMCQITIPSSPEVIKSCLDEMGVVGLEGVRPVDVYDSVKVFINGDWHGQSFEPNVLVRKLKTLRRQGLINPFISIAWYIQYNEIQIWTDAGRMCRPLYIVDNNKLKITNNITDDIISKNLQWKDLITIPLQGVNLEDAMDKDEFDDSRSIIEYIDINESDTLMIAMGQDNLFNNKRESYSFYNYTHCEIHPSMMLGVLASNIPFSEHNQAPRNLYQGAMGKQAMGIYSTAFRSRMDTMAHILHYPQKPLVNTETSKYVHSNDLPSGQMPIVAIACYTGYNQEDSLIFNQSAIDRGLFKSSFYRTYMDEEKKNSATLEDEKFCKPQKYYPNGKVFTEKMSYGSYDKLDDNGFVKTGSYVDGNDIIIGKVTMLKDSIEGEPKARDLSTSLRSNESGIVDMTYKNSNGDGYNFVKVRVRSDRIPEIGDKFASRHGQKGTIGLTYKQEDMPFTKDGIIPDIIMNPNAIPKRMTIAQLIESVFGKVGTIAGCELDATPFRKVTVEDINDIMEKLGYKGAGTEILYNGKTGEQIKASIFMGPTFYYRLKHLVEDKQHCIDYGTEILTKDGFKKHNELTMDDSIATLKDNKLVYEKPIEIYNYPEHIGDMYYVKNQAIDMAVTMEHRMWCSKNGADFNFEYAKDVIDKQVMYKKDAYYEYSEKSLQFIENIFKYNSHCDTQSKKEADKIQQEAIQSGFICTVYYLDDTRTYRCTLNKNYSNEWVDNKNSIQTVIENEKVPVWCVHVPSEVFMIRRNGKTCWTGNSRATGPYQLLTMQPAEGRSRDGGFRFGEMERDCFCYFTPIAQNCGLSIKIGKLENSKSTVLGWSEEKNGIVPALQSDFLYKGQRECVELTMEDGRKITCTPEHKLLTSENEWLPAKDFVENNKSIKVGINYPLIDIDEEITECAGWILKVDDMIFSTNTKENYLETLAFVRILGYLITDGTISYSKTNKSYNGKVSMGHMIDVETFLDDLSLFWISNQTKFKTKNYYTVNLPVWFVEKIVKLKGITVGRKVNQEAEFPHFITDPDCPRPVVREFLAAMFGGDGHTCVLGMHRGKRDILSSVSFSKTKNHEHLDSLRNMMENIKMLFNKCGIEKITIQKFKEITWSKNKNSTEKLRNYEMNLHFDISELISFSEKIGFRYCCHKSQRLEAGVSYRRLRENVIRQHNWLVKRVDEITNFSTIKKENPSKIVGTKKAIAVAVEELTKIEPILHEYAIPSTHDITDNLLKGTEFGNFASKTFPTAEQFLEQIGALEWFNEDIKKIDIDELENSTTSEDAEDAEDAEEQHETNSVTQISSYGVNRNNDSLPTMNLKVLSCIPAGLHKVYDIQVDEVHSFLANGIVAHNCMLSHGAIQFLKERTFDCSDKYYCWIDKESGTISPVNPEKGIYKSLYTDNTTRFAKVQIPYSSKLLIQELTAMHILPRMFTK